jgi:arylsulfatase A-like enzyme
MFAPNIDRLAASGALFTRAYAQYAVCNPSRASLMTGRRPDSTRIYDLNTHFRVTLPDVVTIPQHFRANGYATTGIGKVYHLPLDDPRSWSLPSWSPEREIEYRDPVLRARLEAANPDGTSDVVLEHDHTTGTILRTRSRSRVRGPAWEIADVADEALPDGRIASRAIETLAVLKDSPFFLGIGFKKPHLPFVAPRRYFDLYPEEQVRLAANAFAPLGLPHYESHRAELPAYDGIPPGLDLSDTDRRALVRGYSAAATYCDAQIGRVLDALDGLGLAERTIVVLFGDHGYFLGENGFWAKHNNMEVATRAPLIIRAPGVTRPGERIETPVELVDLFATLIDVAELPDSDGLEGTSLAGGLSGGRLSKGTAFSQYRRGGAMGRSMRTERYRYTEWRDLSDGEVKARVLFDHVTDPRENVNLAGRAEYTSLVAKLSRDLEAGWRRALAPSRA